jgi:hypothetical protein
MNYCIIIGHWAPTLLRSITDIPTPHSDRSLLLTGILFKARGGPIKVVAGPRSVQISLVTHIIAGQVAASPESLDQPADLIASPDMQGNVFKYCLLPQPVRLRLSSGKQILPKYMN